LPNYDASGSRSCRVRGPVPPARLATPPIGSPKITPFLPNFYGEAPPDRLVARRSRYRLEETAKVPDRAEDARLSPPAPAALAHLNMLQAVITRLAGDSAQCKTWWVVIVSALLGLAGATKSGRIAAAAIIPLLVFGSVDAAYLANEKAYCNLHNAIAGKSGAATISSSTSPICAHPSTPSTTPRHCYRGRSGRSLSASSSHT
jgi:hypothetical protein